MSTKRLLPITIAIAQVGFVIVGALLLWSGKVPLGVKGEWEWIRISAPADRLYQLLAMAVFAAFAGFAVLGYKRLQAGKHPAIWLALIGPLALVVSIAAQEAAPQGYGLAKWAIALHNHGSSGYYTVARNEIHSLPEFLANYPDWIKRQDALHIGTHPPGLFIISWGLLRLMETNPELAKSIAGALPGTLDLAFRSLLPSGTLPTPDRAALAFNGLLIAVCCAFTTLPLYALARSRLEPALAWIAACLWAVVPAALMFQPASDAAFPLLSTTAFALAAWSAKRRGLAVACGVLLGLCTQFTLAFFPVGSLVAIVYWQQPESTWRKTAISIGLTGLGFLAVTFAFWGLTGANPFAIWRINAANHARFYVQYPRSYLAWVLENPVELAVAIGLPTALLAIAGFRSAPKIVWVTATLLLILTLSGKNLSEVARLWLPLMPPLLLSAATAYEKFMKRPAWLFVTIVTLGVQILILEAAIQVVYPI